MRLMQHMFPQLLTEVPERLGTTAVVDVPEGAVLLKSEGMSSDALAGLFGGVFTGLGNIAQGVGNIVASGANSRAIQTTVREQTLQADIAAKSAAEARAQQLAIVKYIVPAALLGLVLILIFR